jgi:Tfp pilus assembly protein PilE
MPMRYNSRAAFSLVELAIVLAVIGLITGAVMAGQSMVRASKVKSVTADLTRYRTAAANFQDRFVLLPGDMTNATSLWGIVAGTGSDATCYDATSLGSIRTCNGDGDSTIDVYNETFRFWQHLSNAQMIEGSFTGTKGSSSYDHDVGSNSPATKLANVGIGVTYSGSSIASATQFDITPLNYFVIGAETAGAMLTTAAFSPAEMLSIDTKTDDAIPGRGIIIAGPWATCTNAAANTDLTTTYKLTSSSTSVCWFYLVEAF